MLGLLGFAYWMQKLNKAWDKEALLYVCVCTCLCKSMLAEPKWAIFN